MATGRDLLRSCTHHVTLVQLAAAELAALGHHLLVRGVRGQRNGRLELALHRDDHVLEVLEQGRLVVPDLEPNGDGALLALDALRPRVGHAQQLLAGGEDHAELRLERGLIQVPVQERCLHLDFRVLVQLERVLEVERVHLAVTGEHVAAAGDGLYGRGGGGAQEALELAELARGGAHLVAHVGLHAHVRRAAGAEADGRGRRGDAAELHVARHLSKSDRGPVARDADLRKEGVRLGQARERGHGAHLHRDAALDLDGLGLLGAGHHLQQGRAKKKG